MKGAGNRGDRGGGERKRDERTEKKISYLSFILCPETLFFFFGSKDSGKTKQHN